MATSVDADTMNVSIRMNKKFYMLVDSKDIIDKFTRSVSLHPDDIAEMLRQVFDTFMDKGLGFTEDVHPILSMLRTYRSKKTKASLDIQGLTQAYRTLFNDIKIKLAGIGMDELVRADSGQFNYRFSKLRQGHLLLERLATTPTSKLY